MGARLKALNQFNRKALWFLSWQVLARQLLLAVLSRRGVAPGTKGLLVSTPGKPRELNFGLPVWRGRVINLDSSFNEL
ncbi:MAG: hypothetical protein A2527_06300 [Candidatus Lambdaproteobacteria bacterium RIFOXYD2_FULL_50_16]|uniref:Uncharacterized protein n=1 Tax=Candidatus Lambdaproteobacteria bacterium RIFOXYD2_FULL_50_16 TaxID=1817772 RepID=A0A1F6GA08_9PROT|nr:MAG: hypothetical protein A2527_06300 [Candidatus Lambdaproteobacteria bacterium RIFOXYD2_FULL_50_16]